MAVALIGAGATVVGAFLAYLGVKANSRANATNASARQAVSDTTAKVDSAGAAVEAQKVALEGLRQLITDLRTQLLAERAEHDREVGAIRAVLAAEQLEREQLQHQLAGLERLYRQAIEQLERCSERVDNLEAAK